MASFRLGPQSLIHSTQMRGHKNNISIDSECRKEKKSLQPGVYIIPLCKMRR